MHACMHADLRGNWSFRRQAGGHGMVEGRKGDGASPNRVEAREVRNVVPGTHLGLGFGTFHPCLARHTHLGAP